MTSLIGLDIGSRFIKAIELTRTNEKPATYVLTEFAKVPVEPQASIPDVINSLYDKKNFTTREVVSAVSGKPVFIRHVNMTQINEPRELKEAAKYEIGKLVPIQDINELIYDCEKVEDLAPNEKGDSEMRVIIAAVRKTFIATFISTLESAQLIPEIIDLESTALFNAYCFLSKIKPSAVNMNTFTALTDIGASKVTVHIAKGDKSYFTRESYKAGDEVTDTIAKKFSTEFKEAEQLKYDPKDKYNLVVEATGHVIDEISHDIKASIDYFEGQYDAQVEQVLVTGGGSITIGLLDHLQKLLAKDVKQWNPFDEIERQLTSATNIELTSSASQAVIALGLAARLAEND